MRVSARTAISEQDCQAPVCLEGRRSVACSLWSILAQGSGPSLLGAEVGNSLSCFLQGLQQNVHAVLRVDANLLVGQVNVKLNSSQLVEHPADRTGAAFTGHVHRELVLRHGCGRGGGGGGGGDGVGGQEFSHEQHRMSFLFWLRGDCLLVIGKGDKLSSR